jgi:hypothetical protein
MSVTIYIPLNDEGTDTWRPVHAARLRDDVYEIEVDQEPPGERWTFPPRSIVRCREHTFDDGHQGLLAVELVQLRAGQS